MAMAPPFPRDDNDDDDGSGSFSFPFPPSVGPSTSALAPHGSGFPDLSSRREGGAAGGFDFRPFPSSSIDPAETSRRLGLNSTPAEEFLSARRVIGAGQGLPTQETRGTGGKMRPRSRNPPLRRATPYDRPAPRPPPRDGSEEARRDGLATRLVSSASRLLASSASFLLSSLFTKEMPDEDTEEGSEGSSESSDIEADVPENTCGLEDGPDVGNYTAMPEKRSSMNELKGEIGMTELEKIFSTRNFSREEANYLVKTLESRVIDTDNEVQDEGIRNMKTLVDSKILATPQSDLQLWQEERMIACEEKAQEQPLYGRSSEEMKFLNSGNSVPVDIAKAFMRGRLGQVSTPSPSFSSSDALIREEGMETSERSAGVRTWRRAQGITWSSTSRPQLPPLSERLKLGRPTGSNGWGSLDPVRRIRQKPHLTYAPSNPSSLDTGGIFTPAKTHTGTNLLSPSPDMQFLGRNRDTKTPDHLFVPPRSSETARKILDTLENLSPLPRGKSFEEEFTISRETPAKPADKKRNDEIFSEQRMLAIEFMSASKSKSPSLLFSDLETERLASTRRSIEKESTDEGKTPISSVTRSDFHGSSSTGKFSTGAPLVSDISSSDIAKRRGFQSQASFQERKSEGQLNNKGSKLSGISDQESNSSAFPQSSIISTPASFGSKAIASIPGNQAAVVSTGRAYQPEPVFSSSSCSNPAFTFPVLFHATTPEPPTPKPLFSSEIASVSSLSPPIYKFREPAKGLDFSFAAKFGSDSDSVEPTFIFRHERKPELAFSAVATTFAPFWNHNNISVLNANTTSSSSVFGFGIPEVFNASASKIPSSNPGSKAFHYGSNLGAMARSTSSTSPLFGISGQTQVGISTSSLPLFSSFSTSVSQQVSTNISSPFKFGGGVFSTGTASSSFSFGNALGGINKHSSSNALVSEESRAPASSSSPGA